MDRLDVIPKIIKPTSHYKVGEEMIRLLKFAFRGFEEGVLGLH